MPPLEMSKKYEEQSVSGRIFIIKNMVKQSQIFYKNVHHCVYTAVNLYHDGNEGV